MTPTELADRIEHATNPPGGTWGDYVRLDYDCWRMVIAALRSTEAVQPVNHYMRFAIAVRGLVNGSPFDLTDSPKSFIATVQRLVRELDECLDSSRDAPEGKE